MSPAEAHSCGLHRSAAGLLQRNLRKGRLRPAVAVQVERLARTLADLEGAELVTRSHIVRTLGFLKRSGR